MNTGLSNSVVAIHGRKSQAQELYQKKFKELLNNDCTNYYHKWVD